MEVEPMINTRLTSLILIAVSVGLFAIATVLDSVFGYNFAGSMIIAGGVFPSIGLAIYIIALSQTDERTRYIMVLIASVLTGLGLIMVGVLLDDVSGFLAYFFARILYTAGVVEIALGIVYIMMGDKLITILRNATWRG